jgi:hypothetical protein
MPRPSVAATFCARVYNIRVTRAEYRGNATRRAAMAQRTIEQRYRTLRHKRFSLIVRTA